MPKPELHWNPRPHALHASAAAAALLLLLCCLTLLSGVSQQTFEHFFVPATYARMLVEQAAWLRWIIGIDDVFIVAYCAATVLMCLSLQAERTRIVYGVLLAAALGGGVLDWNENHHILSMLGSAELGLVPDVAELHGRVVSSSLKWMLGHGAFALLAFTLDLPGALGRAARASLLLVQLPVGAAALVVVDPYYQGLFTWARYACLLSGFLGMAWLMARAVPLSSDAAGSGARA